MSAKQQVRGRFLRGIHGGECQTLQIAPGATVHWTFDSAGEDVQADAAGCVTLPGLKMTADPAALVVRTAT